ncbi:redox-sensitive transcriptional activator SoxR [Granulicoccus phenolivorans]|uniref:redox-sensitive transcriptional activator SoxR n=1 Tax=Granulicoccus phenolivorans TaxID=266854 RepID=UPI00047CC93D|nr:redox-sensitive transcriptional activator SoxR [Granulicoccus phenolivorans]
MAEEWTMSEIVARSGVSASALRFYEERGLIAAHRSPTNRRTYGRHTLRRLAVIRAAQAVGLSLGEIAAALAHVPLDRPVSRQEWEELSASWRAQLELRIRALTQLRDGLTGCIGCGCLSQTKCPLWNPEDRLAAQGPGPRILDAVVELEEGAEPRS